MTTSKTLSAVQRTKQYQSLLSAGLKLVSTERQLQNGTLAFSGKLKVGRKTVRPTYAVTANGAVISNEFVARRVQAETPVATYRKGLEAVSEILSKRLTA
jgi:hypothetical protein